MAAATTLARRCLPYAAFLTTFTVVMMILLMSTDIRVPRRRKSLNLSEDLDFRSVVPDDPQLIAYIQAVHLRYPHNSDTSQSEKRKTTLLPPLWTMIIAKLLYFKRGAMFVEAGAYSHGLPSDTEWLERELGWHGLLIQSNPIDYVTLRKHSRPSSYCLHGCLSPTSYPKEVTVRGSSKLTGSKADQADYLFSRVKCFPLYSLLLAVNVSSVDYLSLNGDGTELQVLKTIPMGLVTINVIGVRWHETQAEHLFDFMESHKYQLERKFDQFYLFVHQRVTQ